jgi:hypothetical protein
MDAATLAASVVFTNLRRSMVTPLLVVFLQSSTHSRRRHRHPDRLTSIDFNPKILG